MQLYLVVCEVEQKKHVKRIYKNLEECLHYLDSIFNEIQNNKSEAYHIISYDETGLILEEMTDNPAEPAAQRKYTVVNGDITEMLSFWADLINDEPSGLL
jgi:hypothetical protein